MIFRNREEAASLLADALVDYRGQRPLVLAIPRGAAPMAKIIADALEGEADVVLVHKLGAPENPELAVGAVDETGQLYLSDGAAALGLSQDYLERERQAQLDTLRRRRALYTAARAPIDPAGRVVIVVDDGIATGSSMVAALRAVRARKPATLIAATAVAPPQAVRLIEEEADDVVCLQTPSFFYAVGQFFQEFPQVSDEEVIAALKETPSDQRRHHLKNG
jgi:predicted phosphoribosyltransferase